MAGLLHKPAAVGRPGAAVRAKLGGVTESAWPFLPAVAAIGVAVVASYWDWRWRLIPNTFIVPGLGMSLVACLLAATCGPDPSAGWRGPAGGVIWAGLLLPAALRGALGMGDVKLAGLLGLGLGPLGWPAVILGLVLAVVGGGLHGLAAAFGRSDWQTAIPYGPWLTAGALAAAGWRSWGQWW